MGPAGDDVESSSPEVPPRLAMSSISLRSSLCIVRVPCPVGGSVMVRFGRLRESARDRSVRVFPKTVPRVPTGRPTSSTLPQVSLRADTRGSYLPSFSLALSWSLNP